MALIQTNTIGVEYKLLNTQELDQIANKLQRIGTEDQKLLSEMRQMNAQFKANTTAATQSANATQKGIQGIQKEASGLSSTLKGIGPLIAGAFAVSQIKDFVKEIINVTTKYQQYQKAIDFATGSSENGAKAFQFLQDTAVKYGLDLRALTEGYKGFAASSKLAGTSMDETNRQFLSVAKAAATLGLDSSRTSLVLNGLAQIASKGVVSMEELRQQIGDSLPGALGIAARSMGMTTAAFIKFTSEGKLASDVFLPRFATELEKTFGPNADKNLKSLTASQNRFNTSMDQLILSVGSKLEPFLKGAYDLAAGIATQLTGIGGKGKTQSVENVAAKRAEADIAQKILDISMQQGVFIERRAAANQLLFTIDQKIDQQLSDNANSRIAKDKIKLAAGERNLQILQAEEAILLKISGVEVTNTNQKVKSLILTKEQYEAQLKLLDLEERIALIQAKIANPNQINLITAELKVREKFTAQKIALDRKAEEAGLEGAKNNRKLRTNEIELQREETVRSLQQTTRDAKTELQKQIEDNNAFDLKRGIDQQEQLQKEKALNKELIKLEEDKAKAIKAIDDKAKADKKEAEQRQKEEMVSIVQAAAAELSNIAGNIANLKMAQLDNELSNIQKVADEEVRLADGNQQKINTIREKQAKKEKEIREKQFRAQQAAAIAQVVFRTAPIIAQYIAEIITAPLAVIALAGAAAQIGFILAQPIPAFKEGTKGKAHKGLAIVGDGGESELITTQSGKSTWSPSKATLAYFSEPTHVTPKSKLPRELFTSSILAGSRSNGKDGLILKELSDLNTNVKGLPIHQVNMNKKGFETWIRTPNRATEIRNSRFPK